jgi:hypothetical protein
MTMLLCLLVFSANGQSTVSSPNETWHIYYVAVEKDSVFYFGFKSVKINFDGSVQFRDKNGLEVKLGGNEVFLSKEQLTNKSIFDYKKEDCED